MSARKLRVLLALMTVVLQSCASTYSERISSDPPGALIYWGGSPSEFVDSSYVTPFERSIRGREWERRCYQVKKEGYYDSDVICKPMEAADRNIQFSLKLKPVEKVEIPKAERETAESVQQEHTQVAENTSVLLSAAIREQRPKIHGPAAKYLERYLKDTGHWCYVEILPSRKYKGKYVILINRYSSEGDFDKTKFTATAILATASLAAEVKWNPSDLFFDYSAFFEMGERNIGWAIISVKDCIEARELFLSKNNLDEFADYWKARIQFIADTDPQPML